MISSFGVRRYSLGGSSGDAVVDAGLKACSASATPFAAVCSGMLKRDAIMDAAGAAINALGIGATGVKECWFYFRDVQRAADMTILDLQDKVVKSWYSMRTKLGLPYKANPDAVPRYETTVQTCDSQGRCHGEDKTVFLGNQSRRMLEILSKDPTWNDFQFQDWGSGKNLRRIFIDGRVGPFAIGWDPRTNPFPDCSQYVNEWNSIAASLYENYRLAPAKAAALQTMREMQAVLEKEAADVAAVKAAASSAKAASSSAIKAWTESKAASSQAKQTAVVVGVVGLLAGGLFAALKGKKRT